MTATEVPVEVIVDALELACRAPSLHNSQPWRWVVGDCRVDLFADPERVLRGTDTAGGQALISCGAALDHFRVAMAAAGWDSVVHRYPDDEDRLKIATLQFAAAPTVTERQRRRADAIMTRHTDRLPFTAVPDPQLLVDALRSNATEDAVQIDLVADDMRDSLVEAAQLAEALRIYAIDYHNELYWWTADFVSDDGIPRSALVSASESDRVPIGRSFPVLTHSDRRPEIKDDEAAVVVLSTIGSSREAVLRCGETLSAVLLDATAAGLATCTLTHLTETAHGRGALAALVGPDATAQALVRVGNSPALTAAACPTPRRPLEHVVVFARSPS